ncbi:hypothetical protein HALDL1_07120 [Halobacterium sp. DL1]|jgi:uncharacterized membrane protein (DUF485 family)|nr:hypothetical protein HALDL1_07120 [Halobacterium sp. DL1]
MSSAYSDSLDWTTLVGSALGFAFGALVTGFATLTAWSTAYMNANPAVGAVSGGSSLAVAGMFVAGTVLMFLSAATGLDRILREAD